MDIETQNKVLNALVAQTELLQNYWPEWYTQDHNHRAVEAIEQAIGRPLVHGMVAHTTITECEIQEKEEETFPVIYVRPRDTADTQRFYDLLTKSRTVAIDVHEREIYVTWGSKEDEQKFQQAWRERPIEPIDLYEDSLGNLFLHQKGASLVYQTNASQSFHLENPFDQEAEAISLGDTQDWSEEWVHGYAEMQDGLHHPQTLHIATWRRTGVYELHVMPGDAGKRYLKITE